MSDNSVTWDLTKPDKAEQERLVEFYKCVESTVTQHFKRAADFKAANQFFTTEEICEQLNAYGLDAEPSFLLQILKENNYVAEMVEGKGLCWLIV